MSPLLLSYLVLLLWLSCCLVDSHEHNKQYIISFNVKLKQQDQKQYLSKHFPADAYVYIFRRYVSLHIPSDFAVIQTSQSLDKWLTTSPSYQNECDQNRSLIKSFHEDSLGQSRQLLSDNDEAEDVKTGSDYFDPAHLSSSFSAAGIRGQGVKVAIFDTGGWLRHFFVCSMHALILLLSLCAVPGLSFVLADGIMKCDEFFFRFAI